MCGFRPSAGASMGAVSARAAAQNPAEATTVDPHLASRCHDLANTRSDVDLLKPLRLNLSQHPLHRCAICLAQLLGEHPHLEWRQAILCSVGQ